MTMSQIWSPALTAWPSLTVHDAIMPSVMVGDRAGMGSSVWPGRLLKARSSHTRRDKAPAAVTTAGLRAVRPRHRPAADAATRRVAADISADEQSMATAVPPTHRAAAVGGGKSGQARDTRRTTRPTLELAADNSDTHAHTKKKDDTPTAYKKNHRTRADPGLLCCVALCCGRARVCVGRSKYGWDTQKNIRCCKHKHIIENKLNSTLIFVFRFCFCYGVGDCGRSKRTNNAVLPYF